MKRWLLFFLSAAILLLPLGVVVWAQSGGGYNLTWNTVDGGGSASSGGGYTLNGTAGQPDGGALSGGGYSLGGGFWKGGTRVGNRYDIYLPCLLRNY